MSSNSQFISSSSKIWRLCRWKEGSWATTGVFRWNRFSDEWSANAEQTRTGNVNKEFLSDYERFLQISRVPQRAFVDRLSMFLHRSCSFQHTAHVRHKIKKKQIRRIEEVVKRRDYVFTLTLLKKKKKKKKLKEVFNCLHR